MIRRLAWLIVLLSLPAVGQARHFVRSYPIAYDTYLDESDDSNHGYDLTVEMRASSGNESAPVMLLTALSLLPGETFDSARVVIFPDSSPIQGAAASMYRVIPGIDDQSWSTWNFLYANEGMWWNTPGCYGSATDIETPAFRTFNTWTGSRDSVAIGRGTAFSEMVQSYCFDAWQWVVIHFDSPSPTAFCSWGSSDSPTPAVLRIYGHDATPEPTVTRRRRVMYEH